MARTIRQWLGASVTLRNHPRITRFLGDANPELWLPQRRSVALGAGIGAAVSVLPLPAQWMIAALAAMRFRAHLPTAVVLTFLSNPLTTLPMWGVAWVLGALCLGQPIVWPDAATWSNGADWATWLGNAGQPLLIGIPLLATVLGVAFFGLTHAGWRFAVVRKWRSRPAARRAAPIPAGTE